MKMKFKKTNEHDSLLDDKNLLQQTGMRAASFVPFVSKAISIYEDIKSYNERIRKNNIERFFTNILSNNQTIISQEDLLIDGSEKEFIHILKKILDEAEEEKIDYYSNLFINISKANYDYKKNLFYIRLLDNLSMEDIDVMKDFYDIYKNYSIELNVERSENKEQDKYKELLKEDNPMFMYSIKNLDRLGFFNEAFLFGGGSDYEPNQLLIDIYELISQVK